MLTLPLLPFVLRQSAVKVPSILILVFCLAIIPLIVSLYSGPVKITFSAFTRILLFSPSITTPAFVKPSSVFTCALISFAVALSSLTVFLSSHIAGGDHSLPVKLPFCEVLLQHHSYRIVLSVITAPGSSNVTGLSVHLTPFTSPGSS